MIVAGVILNDQMLTTNRLVRVAVLWHYNSYEMVQKK